MRYKRDDLSQRVTHLLPPVSNDEAVDILCKIAIDEYLEGSSRAVVGKTPVVCFSEAPEAEFIKESRHFSPFGISIDKRWLFHTGGRPVIYQPKEEHQYIDPILHWKLVSFDPCKPHAEGWVDWSWQREWRIQTTHLDLPYEYTIFFVPSEDEKYDLLSSYQSHEHNRALHEELVLEAYPRPIREFPYRIEVL